MIDYRVVSQFKLNDVISYKESKVLSGYIWDEVSRWTRLAQRTVGEQLIRAIDSVCANIAEGFGRYHRKDKIKFYYNARGSVYEVAHWINIAYERKIISITVREKWMETLRKLPRQINTLIKLTSENLKQ